MALDESDYGMLQDELSNIGNQLCRIANVLENTLIDPNVGEIDGGVAAILNHNHIVNAVEEMCEDSVDSYGARIAYLIEAVERIRPEAREWAKKHIKS